MLNNLLLAIIVSASIDSTTLMLGDQTDMHLQATIDAQEQLSFPTFDHLLQDEIEIIDLPSRMNQVPPRMPLRAV